MPQHVSSHYRELKKCQPRRRWNDHSNAFSIHLRIWLQIKGRLNIPKTYLFRYCNIQASQRAQECRNQSKPDRMGGLLYNRTAPAPPNTLGVV